MRWQWLFASLVGTFALAAAGCHWSPQQPFYFHESGDLQHYVGVAQQIEYANVDNCRLDEVEKAKAPLTLENPDPTQRWELSLEEAEHISMANSTVIRNLGGVAYSPTGAQGVPLSLTQSPATAATVYLPAMQEADPQGGVEAALSAFDAQLQSSIAWEKNNTPQNTGPLTSFFRPFVSMQDLGTFQTTISQVNPTGGQASITHNVRYEWNNTPISSRAWPSEWDTGLSLQVVQPFLRGAGVSFNEIAGPGAVPGINRGVMIARLHVDETLADFEGAVRNLAFDVERAYWNLYFAYRRLDSVIIGRDSALQTWRTVWAKFVIGARGGSAQEEAQARQQYYLFVAQVEQAQANLYKTERLLRYIMGLAPTDGRLIYPSTEPTTAKVTFDYYESYAEALVRSVELRRQKWRIKEAELGLIAAKNYLLPQLNGTARYGWAGIGNDLVSPDRRIDPVTGRLNDAYASLTSGDFPSWHLGLDFAMPFGFRREMAGVRFAQLNLTRERKVLQEQELELVHQLQDAFNDLVLNYTLAQTQYDRRGAAQKEVAAVDAAYRQGTTTLDQLLDAQRRLADADASFHQSVVDYNLSITQIHLRKGSLLEYNDVYLAEGPWPAKAYFDARRQARSRDAALYINYGFTRPGVLSRGPYAQFTEPQGPPPETVPGTAPGENMPTPPLVPQPQSEAIMPEPGIGWPATTQAAPIVPPAPQSAPLVQPVRPVQPVRRSNMPQGLEPPEVPDAPHPAESGWQTPRKSFDLGAMDLRGLAPSPAAETRSASEVRVVSYEEPVTTSAASGKAQAWKSIERPRTGSEPVASPTPAPTHASAPGWKAVQY